MWRGSLANVALLVMESLSLFILAGLLSGIGGKSGPGVPAFLIASFGGFGLARGLQRFDLSRRTLIVAGSLISVLVLWLLGSIEYGGLVAVGDLSPLAGLASDPVREMDGHWPAIAGLAVLCLAWARGAIAGSQMTLSRPAALGALTAALAIIVVGLSLGRGAVSAAAIESAAFPAFIAGLLALALLNLGQSEHIKDDSWRGPWSLILLGSIGGLALVAAASGLVPMGLLDRLLVPLGTLVLLLLDLIIYAIALPIVIILNWILTYALRGRLHPLQFPIRPTSQAAQRLQHQSHRSGLMLVLTGLAHLLLLAALLAVVAFVLWWVFSRLRRQSPASGGVVREPVEHEFGLGSDLRSALAHLRRRLVRRARAPEPALTPKLLLLRRLYLATLDRGVAAGIRRPPAATPREFARELRDGLEVPAAELLSHRFSDGRYGLVEPSEEQLRWLHDQLRRGRVDRKAARDRA